MGDNTLYANSDGHTVGAGGGHVRSIVAAGGKGQGNGGVSLPCRVVYLNALSTNPVHVGLSTSVTCSLGCMVPGVWSATASVAEGPMEIPIDDVSRLWFHAKANASIFITYRY